MRQSNIALVVIRTCISGVDSLLLQKHKKWNDWSFVGGHVEPGEENDWHKTAIRESEEELAPLRYDHEFVVDDYPRIDLTWGPVPSQSAKGELTQYNVAYFPFRVFTHPNSSRNVIIKRLIEADDVKFVSIHALKKESTNMIIADPVKRFLAHENALSLIVDSYSESNWKSYIAQSVKEFVGVKS